MYWRKKRKNRQLSTQVMLYNNIFGLNCLSAKEVS